LSGHISSEDGLASVEAVLLTPVLLLMIMTIVQFGLWYHADSVATAAAQDGARAARAADATADDGRVRANAVLDAAGGSIISDRVVLADRTVAEVRVEVRGSCISLVPFVHLPVHAVAESSVERFIPGGPGG